VEFSALFGPHLARGVNSALRFSECENAGFDWFSGDYPYDPLLAGSEAHDGTSRRRILTLLGLLSRGADSRDIELQPKPDPALSFHLPVVAVGGIFFGLFTPTEAGAVAAFWALVLGGGVYRRIDLPVFQGVLFETAKQTATTAGNAARRRELAAVGEHLPALVRESLLRSTGADHLGASPDGALRR